VYRRFTHCESSKYSKNKSAFPVHAFVHPFPFWNFENASDCTSVLASPELRVGWSRVVALLQSPRGGSNGKLSWCGPAPIR
jgi:hypothetical protein